VTIDTHRSSAGRYRCSDYLGRLADLRAAIDEVRQRYRHVQVIDVDYSPQTQRKVAGFFFDANSVPVKAWDGGPFYAYFFGLYAANARHVMHFDGDMMFGGGSRTWIKEALACMEHRPDVLMMAPLAGPPRVNGRAVQPIRGETLHAVEGMATEAYRYAHISTRAFLVDLSRFKSRLGALPQIRPTVAQRLKSRLLGNPPAVLEAERLISQTMQRANLYRIDLLGEGPGLWSLHPPYRSEEFYQRLPEVISAVERGTVPDGQRGDYNLNDSMIDWTRARADNHWHRRYLRMLRQRLPVASE